MFTRRLSVCLSVLAGGLISFLFDVICCVSLPVSVYELRLNFSVSYHTYNIPHLSCYYATDVTSEVY